MKKYLLLLLIFTGSLTAGSQVLISLLLGDDLNSDNLEFGLEGGGNFSSVTGMDSKKYMTDWNLGFYFDIRLKNDSPWYLYTGVLVKSRLGIGKLTEKDLNFLGVNTFSAKGDYYQKINYFLVPVLAKYRFKNRIYIEAGPQFGLKYKAWVEYRSEEEDTLAIIKQFNKKAINPIEAGFMAGTGYRFKGRTGWTIGIKYYYGFVNVYKGKHGTKNNSLFLKVNIPIGRGEQAQAKRNAKIKAKEEKKALKEKNKKR